MKQLLRPAVAVLAACLALPVQAAEPAGTYQRTVTIGCKGLCSFKFPSTSYTRILVVDYVTCGLNVTAKLPPGSVELSTDKSDGRIFLAPVLVEEAWDRRSYAVSAAVRYQVSAGAKMTVTTVNPGTMPITQTCTIVGHYL